MARAAADNRRATTVSGDWLYDEKRDRYTETFPAELDDRENWSGGVVPHVTKAVAERIVRSQRRMVKRHGADVDRLSWDGNVLLLDYSDGFRERIRPDRDGLYTVGFGWTWVEVEPPGVTGRRALLGRRRSRAGRRWRR